MKWIRERRIENIRDWGRVVYTYPNRTGEGFLKVRSLTGWLYGTERELSFNLG